MDKICKNCRYWDTENSSYLLGCGECNRIPDWCDALNYTEKQDLFNNTGEKCLAFLGTEFVESEDIIKLITKGEFGCNQFKSRGTKK